LFGFNISLEILILIGIIYLIMVGHTIGGCCNINRVMEGLETIDSSDATREIKNTIIDKLENNRKKKIF